MDAPSNIKSGGMTFAEQQMQRHGWTEGKGLGKREDGISEAIKVKVKCDTAGVGHNSAEQFTFHWWDHVFNKTASSISVEPDQDGVKVKKLSEDDSAVSNKKPRKAMLHSNMLYGRFIKAATLTSGGEKQVQKSSSSDDSSEDEDVKLDLSSAIKLSDEDLMRICGGRTAHKGARHGLTMSAKLSRIEEQERAFLEKYGKKETKQQPKASPELQSTKELNGDDKRRDNKKKQREGKVDDEEKDKLPKKKKKKHKKVYEEELVECVPSDHDQEHVPSMEEDTRTSKKKKRSKVPENVEMAEEVEILGNHKCFSVEGAKNRPAKKKKGRKTVESEESIMVNRSTEDCGPPPDDGDSIQEREDKECENTKEEARKSKRRKKKKTKDHNELVKAEEHTTCPEEERSGKLKDKKRKVDGEENYQSTAEEKSRKRKKKAVDNEDTSVEEEDSRL